MFDALEKIQHTNTTHNTTLAINPFKHDFALLGYSLFHTTNNTIPAIGIKQLNNA